MKCAESNQERSYRAAGAALVELARGVGARGVDKDVVRTREEDLFSTACDITQTFLAIRRTCDWYWYPPGPMTI